MKRLLSSGLLVLGLTLCAASASEASTITLTLTGAGNNVMGGEYIGPYTATSGGTSFGIICDDFASNSFLNETWTANVSTFADLSSTKWGSANANGYYEAAWLSNILYDPTTSASTAGAIQFALWAIFTPTALNSLSGADLTNALYWLHLAQSQTLTASMFSNYVIYTPTGAAPSCSGGPCPTSPPQEFIRRVPEAGSLALMATALCGLFFWRRRVAGLVGFATTD